MTPGPRTAVNRKARQQRVVAAARTRRAAIGAAATRRIVAAAPVLAEDEMGMGFPVAGPAVSTPVVTNYAVAPQPAPFYAAPAPAIPVRAYTSVYFNGRRLLIDPVTNAVVGELYW